MSNQSFSEEYIKSLLGQITSDDNWHFNAVFYLENKN